MSSVLVEVDATLARGKLCGMSCLIKSLFILPILVASFIASSSLDLRGSSHAASAQPIDLITGDDVNRFTIRFNGRPLRFDALLLAEGELEISAARDGDILDTFSDLMDRMGAEVSISGTKAGLAIARPGTSIRLSASSSILILNGEMRRVSPRPRNFDGYFMVPIKSLVEGLGGFVRWDAGADELDISYSQR